MQISLLNSTVDLKNTKMIGGVTAKYVFDFDGKAIGTVEVFYSDQKVRSMISEAEFKMKKLPQKRGPDQIPSDKTAG